MAYYLEEGIMVMPEDDIDSLLPNPEKILYDIVAVGGMLSVKRLIDAYHNGIFPWYSEPPVLWYSPMSRFVIKPESLHISKSLRKDIKRNKFTYSTDRHFAEVIENCRKIERPLQNGTWITDEIIESYNELHKKGFAHSVEVYLDDKLVGGLYGVAVNNVFCGESMFSLIDNASKSAFAILSQLLFKIGFKLIDCQVETENMERFGGRHISRNEYLSILRNKKNNKEWISDEMLAEFKHIV